MFKSKLHIIELPKQKEIPIEFRIVSPYHRHENLPKQIYRVKSTQKFCFSPNKLIRNILLNPFRLIFRMDRFSD